MEQDKLTEGREMATSPILINTTQEYPLEPGEWKFNTVLAAAGPTVIEISTDGGASFQTETDGSLVASSTGILTIGRGDIFRATIQGGDTLTMSLVRGWGKS